MDAIDRAIEEALHRQRKGLAAPVGQRKTMIDNGVAPQRHSAESAVKSAVDPWSSEAILRAANEDDDLYDPYSDYMDALARSSYEEPEEDPWR